MKTLTFKGSSNLRSAALGDDGVLEVSFQNGTSARFGDVTMALMDEWAAAESAGRWFHNRIRSRPKDHPHIGSDGTPGVGGVQVEPEAVAAEPPAIAPVAAEPEPAPPPVAPPVAPPALVPPQPATRSGARPTPLGLRDFSPWRGRGK